MIFHRSLAKPNGLQNISSRFRSFSITPRYDIRVTNHSLSHPRTDGDNTPSPSFKPINTIESQTAKPLNPNLTNKTSTLRPESMIPSVGVYPAPPELLSSASVLSSEGESQHSDTDSITTYLKTTFPITPLRRKNEDLPTIRSRLQYQSRKRGILETDLLLSTFADAYLDKMNKAQLLEYDLFLEENDWDIYYWATQNPPEEGNTTASRVDIKSNNNERGIDDKSSATKERIVESPNYGIEEWAQTVGKKKEPYRIPPERWRNSEVLKMIRRHVQERKVSSGDGNSGGKGLGRMPDVKRFQ